MHARIDELLNLRDGEPLDAAVRAHIDACAACSSAMRQLAQQAHALRELPPLAPPADRLRQRFELACCRSAGDGAHARFIAGRSSPRYIVCGRSACWYSIRDQGGVPSTPVARLRHDASEPPATTTGRSNGARLGIAARRATGRTIARARRVVATAAAAATSATRVVRGDGRPDRAARAMDRYAVVGRTRCARRRVRSSNISCGANA